MSAVLELRLPPANVEAEQAVLGAILQDNAALDRVCEVVSAKDFYRQAHRAIFEAAQKLIDRGRTADVVTVSEALKGVPDCGLVALGQMIQATPSVANIKHYARIVRDKAQQRALVTLCTEVADQALEAGPKDVTAIIADLEAKVFALGHGGVAKSKDLRSLITSVMEDIDTQFHAEENNGITGTPTGFIDLDQMTTGMQPADLIIVAGRPSMGKTSLAMNIGEHVALEEGLPVLVFSLEMADKQLARRLLGSVSKIDQQKMRNGKLNDDDWHRLTKGVGRLHEAPIHIEETTGLTITDLRARARRVYRERGSLGLIVVDYIGLIAATAETRALAISDVSRGLKALAKELSVPVLALSQLNRDIEKRVNKRPQMSDLRDSGSLEQDADLILFLHADDSENAEPGVTELIVGKQRNGPTGTVKLSFLKEFTRFENYAVNPDFVPKAKKKKERGFAADRATAPRADIDG